MAIVTTGIARYVYKNHFNFNVKEVKDYILTSTIRNISVIKASRKTGILEFLIFLESIGLMNEWLVIKKKLIKYLITNKLSQDHLKLFLNQLVVEVELETAYKRLLFHSQMSISHTGNVFNLEQMTI